MAFCFIAMRRRGILLLTCVFIEINNNNNSNKNDNVKKKQTNYTNNMGKQILQMFQHSFVKQIIRPLTPFNFWLSLLSSSSSFWLLLLFHKFVCRICERWQQMEFMLHELGDRCRRVKKAFEMMAFGSLYYKTREFCTFTTRTSKFHI